METPTIGKEETPKSISTPTPCDSSDSSDDDITFNRLKELQTLIKKESALKELCMKFN